MFREHYYKQNSCIYIFVLQVYATLNLVCVMVWFSPQSPFSSCSHRVRTSEHGSISSDIFSVIPRIDVWKHIPLFGAKYDFKLHGVVDLPEYLVYFPLLVE